MDVYTRRRVARRERLDELMGPAIFVANHNSHMDTPVILRALPGRWRRRTAVAAATDYFYGKRRNAVAASLVFGTMPLDRNSGAGVGPRQTAHLGRHLREGGSLLVFPEGTRSRDGRVGRLRSGAALLAAEHRPADRADLHVGHPRGHAAGAPLDGLQGQSAWTASPIEIRFGDPIVPRPGERRQRGHGAGAVVPCRVRRRHGARARARARPNTPGRPDVTRVFVTGASGFIGGALTERLIESGDEVVGLARSDAAADKVAARGAAVARGNLLDEDSIAAGMDGCDMAFHVAGMNSHCPPDPDMLLRVNVEGAEATVRAAARAGIGRMVYTSSAASLGEPAGTVGTEDCVHRGSYLSVYDRSKHEGEQAVFATAADMGVEVDRGEPVVRPRALRARVATAASSSPT